jgi:uncharacterized membrane protein YkvA (DUF1232 family)
MKFMIHLFLLLVRLVMSRDVAWQTKAMIVGGLAYIVSPVDGIPDWIPILGWAEDFTILILIMDGVLNQLPSDLIRRYYTGDMNSLYRFQKWVTRVAGFIPKPLRLWVGKRALSGARRPAFAKVGRFTGPLGR